MIDPEILRRPVGKRLFNCIKEDQLTMNRFQVSVKHELSLVSVRFAFQAHNFIHFQQLVQRGLVFEKGNVGERVLRAKEVVNDVNFVEDDAYFNPSVN